jgi:hypothetical protein
VNAWILLPMSLSRCSLHLPRLCILFFELLSLHRLPFHLATEPPQTLPLPAAPPPPPKDNFWPRRC